MALNKPLFWKASLSTCSYVEMRDELPSGLANIKIKERLNCARSVLSAKPVPAWISSSTRQGKPSNQHGAAFQFQSAP